MKRTISFILCFLFCFSAFCQQNIRSVFGKAADGRVSFNFRFNQEGKKKVSSGTICIQRNCFVLDMGDTKVYCDGQSRWTVDCITEEVYIEDGRKLPAMFADPSALESCISGLSSSAGRICGVYTLPDNKTRFNFEISNLKSGAASGSRADFAFDVESLGDSWVVTDLR